jgi:hypothetical protein
LASEKLVVIEHLYELYKAGHRQDGIVTSQMIVDAIEATKADLGKANQANFLKDIIRTTRANANWPESLKNERVTARQTYGSKRVFQFRPYAPGQTVPFPDRFFPDTTTPIHSSQSASISSVARQLGRTDETWLIQVAVNLKLIESQLSIFSPQSKRLRDVDHLQIGVKGTSEIDATFLVSYETDMMPESVSYLFITCEAKQLEERILEDQIREQVAVAMESNKRLDRPVIDGVKPMAIKVVPWEFNGQQERMIFVVEFKAISREEFTKKWSPPKKGQKTDETSERLYQMPLEVDSQALYRIVPPVGGLNLEITKKARPAKPKKRTSSAKRSSRPKKAVVYVGSVQPSIPSSGSADSEL